MGCSWCMLVVTCYTRDAQNVQVEGNKVSFIDFFACLSSVLIFITILVMWYMVCLVSSTMYL